MHAEREFIHIRTLAAEVEDANLGIGHTTVEARFGIWLLKNTIVSSETKGIGYAPSAPVRASYRS